MSTVVSDGILRFSATTGSPCAVVLIGPLPPPPGGMANQTRQLAELLQGEGCRVSVVQVNAPYRPAWVARVRGVRALFRLLPYALELSRRTRDADVVHIMANSGWSWHLCAVPAILVARARGKPAIVNYRGGEAEVFLARQSRWILPPLRLASSVIVPSGFLQAVFARWGIEAEIVPNVVDAARFVPDERPSGPPQLLVTRNLEDIYDIATALRAFALVRKRFPDARLTVAGSGSRRGDLERLASELGIAAAVTFTGQIDNKQIHGLYRAAAVLLNASLVDNTPNSLLEAMASGVPIVSTNVGGIPQLVRDGETGLLVSPGNPGALAAASIRVLSEPELSERLRAAGVAAARDWTWERVRMRLFSVYASAMHRTRSGERVS